MCAIWSNFLHSSSPSGNRAHELSQYIDLTRMLRRPGTRTELCLQHPQDDANLLFIAADSRLEDIMHLEDILALLIDIASDLEIRDSDELTTLLYAAKSDWPGSLPCLNFLVHHDADVFAVDKRGCGALHILISSLEELYEHWSHMGKKGGCCDEQSMISPAFVEDKLVVLLDAGCDPVALDYMGRTPAEYLGGDERGWTIWLSALTRSSAANKSSRTWKSGIELTHTDPS